MTFTRTTDKSLTRHLICEVPFATISDMMAAFGEPDEGATEEDKGYSGEEWTFKAENGETFTVYPRYGRSRVGGLGFEAEAFTRWLLTKVGG